MNRLRTGLYEKEYELLDQSQAFFDTGCRDPERLAETLGAVLKGYHKLLTETEKVNFIVDRHYSRLVKTQKTLLVANQELELISLNDKLTGLYNRRKFDEVISREVLRFGRFGGKGSLIFADIDHFKQTNDNFGHLVGDQVLVQVASILARNIRKIDYCFRWGGEEFLILLTETSQDEALALAEKLRTLVESYEIFPSGRLTASFGVQEYRQGWDQDGWITEADRALFQAKLKGRNRVEGPVENAVSN